MGKQKKNISLWHLWKLKLNQSEILFYEIVVNTILKEN